MRDITRKPAKLRHKDRDARWTVKFTKAKPHEDGSSPTVDLAIPVFGYQNHISIDRGFGFIRDRLPGRACWRWPTAFRARPQKRS